VCGLAELLLLTIGSVAQPGSPQAPGGPLPVPAEAADIVARGSRDAPTIEYLVRESYPALRTIDFLMQSMSQGGWKLVEVDGFAPAPWPEPYASGRGATATHTWNARWRNQRGREAGFWLDYRCPMESSRMHSTWVRVRGGILSVAVAARLRADRKIREEQACKNARSMGLPADPRCRK